MGIRNSIVNPFGLKTDRNERINRNAEIVIGKKKNHASNLPPPFTNENPIFKHLGKGLTLIWTCFTKRAFFFMSVLFYHCRLGQTTFAR